MCVCALSVSAQSGTTLLYVWPEEREGFPARHADAQRAHRWEGGVQAEHKLSISARVPVCRKAGRGKGRQARMNCTWEEEHTTSVSRPMNEHKGP